MDNLRTKAASDLSFTLQDNENGFGWPMIIEDNQSNVIGNDVDDPFYGQVGRVHFFIDPDTGVGVEGNFAHVAARMSDLIDAGMDVDNGGKGWFVTTADINGGVRSYSVKLMTPDHTIGLLTIICDNIIREDNSVNEALIEAILNG